MTSNHIIISVVDSLCTDGVDMKYMQHLSKIHNTVMLKAYLSTQPSFLCAFYDQQDSYSGPIASWKTAKCKTMCHKSATFVILSFVITTDFMLNISKMVQVVTVIVSSMTTQHLHSLKFIFCQ